ncbi:MAG: ABC transporter permease [Bacteroidetes bacterium]|nr:ABC transporter permease [Bacteroidota bacterium]
MNIIYKLIKKEIIRFLNDKTSMMLTFIVPIILMVIFGNIFGGHGSSRGKANLILINNSNSEIAKFIEQKLDSTETLRLIKNYSEEFSEIKFPYTEEIAKEHIKKGKISSALILPENFFTDTSSSLLFKFYYDPKNEIESAMIQGSVQQTIMSQVGGIMPVLMMRQAKKQIGENKFLNFSDDLKKTVSANFGVNVDSLQFLGGDFEKRAMNLNNNNSSNVIGNLVKFDSEQLVGADVKSPGLTRSIGGIAMMFMLFTLTAAANSMFEEKSEGTLNRLLCMPVKRSHILWSKYIYSLLLGIFQLLVLFTSAWLIFDLDIFSNFINLIIVIIASAAAAVSFGMIITSFAKNINQASGLSTLLILVMSAIGGAWFPIFLLPDWMQSLARGTLTFWAVEAYIQVLWRSADFSAIALNVLVLLSIAFIINFYSLLRFRKGKVFR